MANDWLKRISTISDEAASDFSEAVSKCLELGISKMDLRLIGGARVPYISEDSLKNLLRILKERPIDITGVSPGFFKGLVDSEETNQELHQGLEDVFRFINQTGGRRLNLFTFYRTHPEAEPPGLCIEILSRAVEKCRREGIVPILENVPTGWGSTGETLGKIAAELDIEVAWDPANAAACGEEAFPYGYSQVKNRINLIHLRNWRRSDGYVYLKDGFVDINAQIMALIEDDFPGDFCLENHRWQDPLALEINLRQLLAMLVRS